MVPMSHDDSGAIRTARHLFERARQFQQRGALGDAIRLYKESLAHHPTAEAHTHLGWSYAMLRAFDAALAECERAILLDPEYGNAYNDAGAYLIELGRSREALGWLEKAIAVRRYRHPEFAHFNLGRAYERLGQWDMAAMSFKVALTLNPAYALARQHYRLLIGKMN